jgi:lipopolysaccharide assembly outer membrane protein LptD (OstA)
MRLLALTAFLSISATVVFGQEEQTLSSKAAQITLLAEHEVRDGATLKLRGRVQVISASTTVYADEADYNPLTGDLNVRGHVHVSLKSKPSITIQDSTPEDMPATISPK